nr:nucleoside diphosphate-linked moiety X motif 6-like isoform X2 [Lytechinus pictus]
MPAKSTLSLARNLISLFCSRTSQSPCLSGLIRNSNYLEIHSRRRFCSVTAGNTKKYLEGTRDRFNCVTIDVAQHCNQVVCYNVNDAVFSDVLHDSIVNLREEGLNAVWLHIPIAQSHLTALAAKQGFTFHHAEDNEAVLSLWLQDGPSRLPAFASHTVGVSGFVLNEEKREVLMIQDKHRLARWKFPGGFSCPGEDIPETAMREVLEETGIQTEFQGVLAFRQQHNVPSAFGRSDIYVVTRLKPVTFDINICTTELTNAAWTPVGELTAENEHTHLTVRMGQLIEHGYQVGFDKVDISMHKLPSVYKDMTYKLFHRPISSCS